MAEIRSPYFSCGVDDRGDNAEIQSPYFSYVTRDYHGDNAEIPSPYFSFGTQDYHRDNAEIHASYYSVGDYDGEDSETDNHELYDYIVGRVALAITAPIGLNGRKCIYRIPVNLRDSMGAIYTPRKISIGPSHHGKENLQPMEEQKVRYFEAFCDRVRPKTEGQKWKFVDKLWKTMEEKEEIIKQCYEEGMIVAFDEDKKIEKEFVSSKYENKFARMVLLDAIFILEYLLRYVDMKKYEDDPILSEMKHWILWDLMLLENQLPFFILDELYNHLPGNVKGKYTHFRDLVCDYFDRHIKSQHKPETDKILHFTDLVRSLLSWDHPELKVREPMERFYTATQLREAEIKFKRLQNECLLKINFTSTKGELTIPCFEINYYTECIFGNIIALEKCHYPGAEYICHYVKLFETLIVKPKDADLLIKNKIIGTSKKGDAVKALIDKLSAKTFEDYSCYHTLYKQLDQHYQKSWPKNRAYFRETYFGNLWKGTATVSAALLLLLTFVQAICAVISLR